MKTLAILLSVALLPGLVSAQVNKDIQFAEEMATFNTELTLEEIDANRAERQRLINERNGIRNRISEYEKQNRTLEKQVEQSRVELAKTEELHRKESKVLNQVQNTNNQLQSANRSLENKIKEADRLVADQRNEIQSLKKQIADAQRTQKRLLERQARVKNELKEKRSALKSLRAQRDRATSRNQSLASDVNRLESLNSEVGEDLSLFN